MTVTPPITTNATTDMNTTNGLHRRDEMESPSKRCVLFPASYTESSLDLTLLMVNDVYELVANYEGLGGLAELSTLLKQEIEKCKTKPIVTLNGDFLSASALAVKHKGAHMVDVLNQLPLDYVVPGNHEFDFGADVVRQRIKESKFQWLCSNIVNTRAVEEQQQRITSSTKSNLSTSSLTNGDGSGTTATTTTTTTMTNPAVAIVPNQSNVLDGCLYKKVIEVKGFKIGMFGVSTRDTRTLSFPGPTVHFLSVLFTAKQVVRELREQDGCHVVIALTHLSVAEDRELARRVHGIDVLLGGHDHDPHTQYQGGSFIHKAGMDAKYLARIRLRLEKKVTMVSLNPDGSDARRIEKIYVFPEWEMILNRGYAPDPAVKQVIDRYLAELPSDDGDEIGLVLSPMSSTTSAVRSKETSFANFTADALRNSFGADITHVALVNGGGIRGDSRYDAGYRMKKSDVRREFPFPNGLSLAKISGKVLYDTLECGLARAELKLGSFPHLSSGCHVVYSMSRPAGQRIELFELNGKPLDLNAEYTIATPTYLLNGGDGYEVMKDHTIIEHPLNGTTIGEVVLSYIEKTRVIDAKKEGRVYLDVKKGSAWEF